MEQNLFVEDDDPVDISLEHTSESHKDGIERNQGTDTNPEVTVNNKPVTNTLQQTTLDIVQLASMVKDFNRKDPLFSDSPDYVVAIIKELLESDFLLILGKGLGLSTVQRLLLTKIKQASPNALVLVLGNQDDELDLQTGDDNAEVIGFGLPAQKRSKLYNKGGIYRITGPIAVVDILTKTLDPLNVSGIVISNAERISEHSPVAFAIRLLKQSHPRMFVKALSDNPERFVMSPSLPIRLRVLGVPTVMLWPRFHLLVDKSLPKLEVDEVIIEQPESVRRQQALLSELFQAVLSDIKRRVPHLDIDYLSPALGSQQQQPHANPDKSHESTTVDSMLATPDLAWRIKNALRGVWHKLSFDGKRSVGALGTLAQLQQTLTLYDARTFREQLEYCRKDLDQPWADLPAADLLVSEARTAAIVNRLPAKVTFLRNILRDIPEKRKVLIVFESPKTAMDTAAYLQGSIGLEQSEYMLQIIEDELRMKDELESKAREQKRNEQVNSGRPGRRRVRGGKNPTPERPQPEGPQPERPQPESVSESQFVEYEPTALKRPIDVLEIDSEGSVPLSLNSTEFERLDISIATLRSHNMSRVKPDHVIIYDPDLTFTRELERYSVNAETVPEVHFMYYQRSVEELQYLAVLRKEKDAFTKLIRTKGLMPMVIHDDDDDVNENSEIRLVNQANDNSARRTYATSVQHKIVVDAREFRSALPFFIWQQRMEVIPLTLLVGDYILTPDIVVERKSITDLVGSFRNGRLYEQCESMLKHYKIAVLLIEFDGPSHFSMEPFKEIRSKTSDVRREIQDNISLLLLRFPKLKLLWSSSPLHSAQIFRSLKDTEPEPEPEKCAMAGKSVLYDSVALSMLEALPGITSGNSYLLAKIASSITDVCKLTKEQLVKTLGPENGTKLYRFLNE